MLIFLYGDDGLPMIRIVTKKQCSEGGTRAAPSSGVIWISGMFGDSDCDSHFVFLFGGGTSLVNGLSAEFWFGPVENILL